VQPDQPSHEPPLPWPRRRKSMPCRDTDIVEAIAAWLMGVCGILGVLAAMAFGHQVHQHTLAGARQQPVQPDSVAQRSVHNPPAPVMIDQGDHSARPGLPTRLDAGGSGRGHGATVVKPLASPHPGTPHPGHGHPQQAVFGTRSMISAMALACWGVALVLACVAVGLWLGWGLVRRWTAARNSERWAREWAEVEPLWSGRTPRRPDTGPG
jgi:hypothetical protein